MGPRLGPASILVAGVLMTTLGWTPLARGGEPPPGWNQDIPTGPVSIEGVKVSGSIDTVSLADILLAIRAFKDIGLNDLTTLSVMNKDEIRGYLANPDLGWFTAERTGFIWPDRTEHPGWDAHSQGLPEFATALRCIRDAQRVYIFPVTTPDDPRFDNDHMRLLSAEARDKLAGLIGSESSWFEGFNNLRYMNKEPTNVGFMFQNGTDTLTLFFVHKDVVVGTFNGEHLSGTLNSLVADHKVDKKVLHEFEKWKAQYAQPELAAPATSPGSN